MTTGAAWKSKNAGPNRIPRWIMLLPDDELKQFGIDMSALRANVVAKLREKAASYDKCVEVAIKLTWVAYQMSNAPTPPQDVKKYLEAHGAHRMPHNPMPIQRGIPCENHAPTMRARQVNIG